MRGWILFSLSECQVMYLMWLFNFNFPLFLYMVMFDNEYKTKKNKN